MSLYFGTCHYVMFSEIRGAATFVMPLSNVRVKIAKFMLKLRNIYNMRDTVKIEPF